MNEAMIQPMLNLIFQIVIGAGVTAIGFYLRRHAGQHDQLVASIDELKKQKLFCMEEFSTKTSATRLYQTQEADRKERNEFRERLASLETALKLQRNA